jgi:hypothetical protein
MEKPELKQRMQRFFNWFGIACLLMVMIRLGNTGQFNPRQDQVAIIGLAIGLLSLLLGVLFKRFF